MRTCYIQRVHSFSGVYNFVSHIVNESEWLINIKKYKMAGFNLNFFAKHFRRYV